MPGPYLEVQAGSQMSLLPLDQPRITVGRHPANTLVVNDERASRAHCVIEQVDDGWQLRDLKSSNGTRLNGDKVDSAKLKPGDIIAIGATTLKYVTPAPAPTDEDLLTDADVVDEFDP